MNYKHIVSYSGGLNSFATAERVINNLYGIYSGSCSPIDPKDVVLVFTDTKSEDEDLYRFLHESAKFLGAELIILSEGRNIWQVFNDMNFMSNSRVDNCSQILKRSLFKRWLKKNFKPTEACLYVGFDWNETHRLPKMRKRYKPYQVCAPLMEAPYIEKNDIRYRLKQIGIKQPRLYDLGFQHNNCGGFCVKTGQAQFKLLWQKLPDVYAYHEVEQEKLFARIGQHGFIRRTENKTLRYLSLKQFREEILEKGKLVDANDIGGCGCFV